MTITIIGPGYVGLPSSVVFAERGHHVFLLGNIPEQIEGLQQGHIHIHEPGLEEALRPHIVSGQIQPTLSYAEAVSEADVIVIAVGTPSGQQGEANLEYVFAAIREFTPHLEGYTVIATKSTVPVGTADRINQIIREELSKVSAQSGFTSGGNGQRSGVTYDVASCPEFLREGTALADARKPDRIVLGVSSDRARDILLALHDGLPSERVVTDPKSAELIKYASNAFLATKISFINEIANICEGCGADVEEVARGMGLDSRIGPKFLKAGLGWSGSCLLGDERVFLRDERGYLHRLCIKDAVRGFLTGTFGKAELLSFDQKKEQLQFARITDASARSYRGVVVRATTKMGRTVAMTVDHPCLVFNDGGIKTIFAKDLTTNDHFLLMCVMPKAKYTQRIDLIDMLLQQSTTFDIGHVKCRPLHRTFRTIPGIRSLLHKHFAKGKSYGGRNLDIESSNCLTVAEFLTIEKALRPYICREDLVLFTQNSGTYCPAIFPITNDTARLIGYYISEGHIHEERGGRVRTQWSFHENEHEFINDVTTILHQLAIHYDHRRNRKSHTVSIVVSSRLFGFLLDDILGCGRTSYTARIPNLFFGASRVIRRNFLQGIFRGDGHISFPNHSSAIVLDFGTISKELADAMVELFQSLGYVASTKKSRSKKSTGWAHFLCISGEAQVRGLLDFKDKKTGERALERLEQYKNKKHIAQTGFSQLNRDVAIVRIRDLQKKKQKTTVYSFEVATTHTFVTSGGIVVHNCFPKDVRALHHIAFSNNYEPQLIKAAIEVNNQQRIRAIKKVEECIGDLHGKIVTIFGLAFKPHTDDARESAAIDLAQLLVHRGATVRMYDPVARPSHHPIFQEVTFSEDPYVVGEGADAIIIATEWPEFCTLNWDCLRIGMRHPVLIDGRNVLNPTTMRAGGWQYDGVGRPPPS